MFGDKKDVEPRTVIRCESCGYDAQREFADGDYIYKKVTCDQCQRTALIWGIFGRERTR